MRKAPLPQPSPDQKLSAGLARVEINLDLDPGTDLEVTLTARSDKGQPIATRVVKFRNPINPAVEPSDLVESTAEDIITPSPRVGSGNAKSLQDHWLRFWASFTTWWINLGRSWGRRSTFWLFVAAVLIYLVVRLIALESFPIYFFTDEAVQTILAQDFLRDGFNQLQPRIPAYLFCQRLAI